MNWAKFAVFAVQILMQVPKVVTGVEAIISGAKQGATKKQLALASLGLSSDVAHELDPAHKPYIDAATVLAGTAIDNTVAIMNLFKGAQSPAPVAAAPDKVVAIETAVPAATFAAAAGSEATTSGASVETFSGNAPDSVVVPVGASGRL